MSTIGGDLSIDFKLAILQLPTIMSLVPRVDDVNEVGVVVDCSLNVDCFQFMRIVGYGSGSAGMKMS